MNLEYKVSSPERDLPNSKRLEYTNQSPGSDFQKEKVVSKRQKARLALVNSNYTSFEKFIGRKADTNQILSL